MTLLSTTLLGLRQDIEGHFQEIFSLLPKAVRFFWLTFQALFILALTPVFGIFLCSCYLWGEANWNEKLTVPQKIVFWTTLAPLSVTQWLVAMSFIGSLG